MSEQEKALVLKRKKLERSVGQGAFWWTAVFIVVFVIESQEPITAKRLVDLGARSGNWLLGDPLWRAVISFFLHWDSFHLASNIVALWLLFWALRLSWPVAWSHLTFFVGGVLGHVVSMRLHPRMVSVGASGGTYALLGAFSLFMVKTLWNNPQLLKKVEGWAIIVCLGINYYSLTLTKLGTMSLDYTTHQAGFATGFGLALIYLLFYSPQVTFRADN